MQFTEKQERQLCHLVDDNHLEFEPIFDKMMQECTNQIAIMLPKSYFWGEEGVQELVSDLSLVEMELQEEFQNYIFNNEEISLKESIVAIEGYYRKCYKNFEEVNDLDILMILYLVIRPRKNIDGIKFLIKVGEDYEL